jgi:hypothetical protein
MATAAKSHLITSALIGILFLLAACAPDQPQGRISSENTTINDKPATLLLDTGTPYLWLSQSSAQRLGLKIDTDYTAPAKLSLAQSVFTTPFPIRSEPWFIRWLSPDDFDGLLGWLDVRNKIFSSSMPTPIPSAPRSSCPRPPPNGKN